MRNRGKSNENKDEQDKRPFKGKMHPRNPIELIAAWLLFFLKLLHQINEYCNRMKIKTKKTIRQNELVISMKKKYTDHF